MMKRLVIPFLLLTAIAFSSLGQQRPIQSLYMFDPLLLNPAYAGTQLQLSATAVYRNQWVNFAGAPKTFTATTHMGFKQNRVGLGLIAGRDQIGVHDETSLYFAYSYKLPLSRFNKNEFLSFGVQGGFNALRSDYTLTISREDDKYGVFRSFNPNFGAGVFYRNKSTYVGFSVPYFLNSEILSVQTAFESSARRYRYYYLTGGTTLKLSNSVKLLPSALIRIQDKAPLTLDATLITVLYDVVGLGVSYRWTDSFIGLFELQLNENFHVGYAYDFTSSDIRTYSNGTHEIMINYRFKISKFHQGLECPSYW
jgi:type IX secretion system PorP/SprF family membrane protein